MSKLFDYACQLAREQAQLSKINDKILSAKKAANICHEDGCLEPVEFPGSDFCERHGAEAIEFAAIMNEPFEAL